MKKSTLSKKIQEISQHLKSSKAQTAIETLKSELDSYKEKVKGSRQVSTEDFVLPDIVKKNSSAFALYTDGACRGNPGPGSYGFIVQNNLGKIITQGAKAFENTTNNKMELSAVIFGLKALKPNITPMNDVYIYTDSKYVVDGMNSWVAGWKKRGWKKADKKVPENVDLWQELDQLVNIANCHFNWVKGHAGHPQNEFVDQLANEVLDEAGH